MLALIAFSRNSLSGVAQVILQPCWLSGLVCIVGIFLHSWTMGLGALLGSVAGTATAYLSKFEPEEIDLGLFGFNGTLVGIANIYLFSPSPTSVTVLILSCGLSALVTRLFKDVLKFPPYTSPFVFITWIVLLISGPLGLQRAGNILNFANEPSGLGFAESVGQVYLQNGLIAGATISIAVLICSRSNFLWMAFSVAATYLFAILLDLPAENRHEGLYGYNAVLTVIALCDVRPMIIPIIGVLLSTIVTYLFQLTDIPPFTAPFFFTTWFLLIARYVISRWAGKH